MSNKKEFPRTDLTPVQKKNLMQKILGFFETLGLASINIFRNKRRSTSMLVGIILGTAILTGLVIYNSVLQEQNYQSIVQSAAYEVSFELTTQGTEADLWHVGNLLQSDPRVDSYTVMYNLGFTRSPNEVLSVTFSNALTLGSNTGNEPVLNPVFVRDNFSETTIASRIFKDGLTGKFDLKGPTNKTVISQLTANRYGLKVGDIINHMNITFIQFGETRSDIKVSFAMIRNVMVTGIYKLHVAEGAGIFGSVFGQDSVYMNSEVLTTYAKSVHSALLQTNSMFLAVKLNEKEFQLDDIKTLNSQINRFINDVTQETGNKVVGENQISYLLLPFSIFNTFILVFDYILIIPSLALLVYVLIFGLELSLEERKREIGILKVQGADQKQIYNLLGAETFLLFLVGLGLGYLGGILSAWVITNSFGFLKFDVSEVMSVRDFFTFNTGALYTAIFVIGGIVFISIHGKGKKFIMSEVTESIQRYQERKEGFMTRNKLDLVFLGFGFISAGYVIALQVFHWEFLRVSNFFIDIILLRFTGAILIWIGGIYSGARIVKWLPNRIQDWVLNISFKDVANIIRSGLRRRGDIDRLIFIIVLTLSITMLAITQGYTDENHSIRLLQHEVGADIKVTFNSMGNHSALLESVDGIASIHGLPTLTVNVLSSSTEIIGYDPTMITSLFWLDDAFKDVKTKDALQLFIEHENDSVVFLGNGLSEETGYVTGDTINVTLSITDVNVSRLESLSVTVLGIMNHAPGGVSSGQIITNYHTMHALTSKLLNTTFPDTMELNATTYLLTLTNKNDHAKVAEQLELLPGVVSVSDYWGSYEKLGEQPNYGITGLLNMMFLTAFIAAFTSSFTFSAILMERRKREFAVLQAIGASKRQIYKTAFGENFMIMAISVIWGMILGLLASYQLNGLFSFIGSIIGRDALPRIVMIPWPMVFGFGLLTFIGMLLATLLSVRSAVNQDLSIATRVD